MDEIMYGLTQIGTKLFHYQFDFNTFKITLYINMIHVTINEHIQDLLGQDFRYISNDKSLFHLDFSISPEKFSMGLAPSFITTVDYIVNHYKDGARYNEMILSFEELDRFIPSVNLCSLDENRNWVFNIEPKIVSECNITYRDTPITIQFKKSSTVNYDEIKAKASTYANVHIMFPQTDDFDYITGLYYNIRQFFSFIFNRRNIALRKAIIKGEYVHNTLVSKGKPKVAVKPVSSELIPNSKYIEEKEDLKHVKRFSTISMYMNHLETLIQMFFEKKQGDIHTLDDASIHKSLEYRNYIDLNHSLHITSTFERYVRIFLPEISSSKATVEFYSDMQGLLDEYINNHTGNKKKKAKDLKNILAPTISLEQKIQKAYNGYSNWAPLSGILSEKFGEDIITLAQKANKWRNELAHEKYEFDPDEDVINSIRLIEHINYCIAFRIVGYSDEEIATLVNQTLAGPI